MKFPKAITLAAVAAAFASTAAFAEDTKKPEKKAADPAARFAKLDKDGNKEVSLDELKAGSKGKPDSAEKMMKAKDKDKNGSLSLEEFSAKPEKKKKEGGEGDKKKKKEAK